MQYKRVYNQYFQKNRMSAPHYIAYNALQRYKKYRNFPQIIKKY